MKSVHMFLLVATGVALVSGCSEAGLGGKHTATSTLRVSSQTPTLLRTSAERTSDKEFEIYKQTQRQLVTCRFVLLAALRKPEVAKLPSMLQNDDPVRWLEGIIKVDFPDDTDLMEVSASRSDPQEATTLVRAVVDAYLTEVVNAERDQKRRRLGELDRLYTERETEFREKKTELEKLAKELAASHDKTEPFPLPVDIEMRQADLKTLEQVLDEIRIEREHTKVECRATPRVTLLQRAEMPETKDEE